MNGISIMGPCACGGSPREPNYHDCERCRLVYFVQSVAEMRQAQSEYFSDRTSHRLERARYLEGRVDSLVKRFLARPEAPDLFSGDDPSAVSDQYFQFGA